MNRIDIKFHRIVQKLIVRYPCQVDSTGSSHCRNLTDEPRWRPGKFWKMLQERTSPDKEVFNPPRRQKDTAKCCHRAMFSGDSYGRPVFAIPGKKDIWELQILTTMYLINTKY